MALAVAATTIPRKDIYLSVLAGRAVTALVALAADPTAWNELIQTGLHDGIVYCQAVRLRGGRVLSRGSSEVWSKPLKRSVENAGDKGSTTTDIFAESEKLERFLSQIASRGRTPKIPELVAAIEFLRKTATDR